MKFMIDDRQHGVHDLPPHLEGLKKFQGPALLSWNDAVFTDDDWESISKIYQSTKETEPIKVGQFGLGFISIYHITGEYLMTSATVTVVIIKLHNVLSITIL